ncbi:MAG: hypothetical protein K2F81_08435 [Ruminococcus sp.]|nr:hypothetical protein [Ruminococcus sp.]
MTKIYNKTFLILIGCFLVIFMSACTNSNTESSSVVEDTKSDSVFKPLDEEESSSELDNIEPGSTFDYPDKSEFSLSAKIQNSNVKSGGSFIIDCSLKNNSDRDFYIEHGSQTITYSYNGDSEFHNLIAILTTFKSNDEIKETLNIDAKKSGTIIVKAEIRVKPDEYTDSYKTYTYTKEIEVTVE